MFFSPNLLHLASAFMMTDVDLVVRCDRTKGLPWGAVIVGIHAKNDELVVYEQPGVYKKGELVYCGLCGFRPTKGRDAVKTHRHHRKCSICHEPTYRETVQRGGGFLPPCRGCVTQSSSSLLQAPTAAPASPALMLASAQSHMCLALSPATSPPPPHILAQVPAATPARSFLAAPVLAHEPSHLSPSSARVVALSCLSCLTHVSLFSLYWLCLSSVLPQPSQPCLCFVSAWSQLCLSFVSVLCLSVSVLSLTCL